MSAHANTEIYKTFIFHGYNNILNCTAKDSITFRVQRAETPPNPRRTDHTLAPDLKAKGLRLKKSQSFRVNLKAGKDPCPAPGSHPGELLTLWMVRLIKLPDFQLSG